MTAKWQDSPHFRQGGTPIFLYLLGSLIDASFELLQGEEALALEEEPPAVYLTLEIGMLPEDRLEPRLQRVLARKISNWIFRA